MAVNAGQAMPVPCQENAVEEAPTAGENQKDSAVVEAVTQTAGDTGEGHSLAATLVEQDEAAGDREASTAGGMSAGTVD
ncbi:hypothetical protein GCK32_020301, partial [Trichostrongylus colubriformis]